jgi:hypothetical protein
VINAKTITNEAIKKPEYFRVLLITLEKGNALICSLNIFFPYLFSDIFL